MADLLETAAKAGQFKTLIEAIEAAGLTETLSAEGPFTILAPTDQAFSHLPDGELDRLKQNISELKQVLLYHVVFGDVRAEDLAQIREAPTVEGSIVVVEHSEGIKINDATVMKTDILTDNGVIHIIDTVLVPTILIPE
ncbi:MAG: fasciclin domain-containing protein [Cyanobacteria bacterium RM1_2_2]|nr:fasciclin domain-containing protein [Cyanobacteria bacterium RM1_2_2]